MTEKLESATSIDPDAAFRQLMIKPKFAWPTIALGVLIVVSFTTATTLALTAKISFLIAMLVNTLCSYAAYTILHEASHGLISKNRALNDWMGRIGLLMVAITPFFRAYRFLHMTHHRFANDPEKDPDYFCGSGPTWTLPIRWMIMDYAYVRTYFHKDNYSSRPKGEKFGFWLSILFATLVFSTVFMMGWVFEFLVLYIIPTRIALFFLAITFDYLPHYPHGTKATDNKYRATNNRVGMEWLFTPLFIGHNYHLSHHLYPNAPFYRYRKIWLSRPEIHQANNPAIVENCGLAPLDNFQHNDHRDRSISTTDGKHQTGGNNL